MQSAYITNTRSSSLDTANSMTRKARLSDHESKPEGKRIKPLRCGAGLHHRQCRGAKQQAMRIEHMLRAEKEVTTRVLHVDMQVPDPYQRPA